MAAVQFVNILDFMIVMPLGPQLLEDLGIDATRFSWVVSAYTLAAGLAGLLISRGSSLILEGLDFSIVEAEDGEQALGVCQRQLPDAVLLDWNKAGNDNPSWFYNDGIHLNPAGRQAYAELVMSKLNEGLP